MVKSIVSIISVFILILSASICERLYVTKQFDELNQRVMVVYLKVDDKSAKEDDVYALQKSWLNKKERLHVFVPHADLKEIDLWLAESATLVRDEKWEDALSKLEVLLELTEQAPKYFGLSIENIF